MATPGDLPWEDGVGMGWMLGRHRAHRLVHHAGMDPGFGARVALVPQARAGVIVLANSNTVLTSTHNCTVSQMLRPQRVESSRVVYDGPE